MRNQRVAQLPAGGQSKQHTVVSLFSGCGGMDLGFRGGFPFGGKFHQRLPFEVVWANDINESACDTYAANLGEDHLHRGSIVDVMDTLPESADVVVGGFPCQDVSINGQRSAANGARTILYQRMIDVIRHCQPAVFVAENVKGLLMSHGRTFFNQMLADFHLPGYTVDHRLYLAADYGVPQMRERIFIVGVRGNVAFAHPPALAQQAEKRKYRAEAALLSPQVCKGSRARGKYEDAAMYLLTYHGVFCPQARDLFTAGSVALRADQERGGNYLLRALQDIEPLMLDAARRLDDALFVEYWGESCPPGDRIPRWLELADGFARGTGWKPSNSLFKKSR